jgi:YVTN family beta-propeller protein
VPHRKIGITIGASLGVLAALGVAGFAGALPATPGSSGYHVLKTISLPGTQAFDYLSMDSDARRLYIARQDHVAVVDVDSGTLVGNISDLNGVHGIALAPELGRGFTTNGGDQTSTIVDLKTLQKIGTVKTVGKNPDSMAYDSFTKRAFIMDAASDDVTVIDAVSGTVAGSIALAGTPEFVVADGKGKIYINITDKGQIGEFDGMTLQALHYWSLAPGYNPSGLSIDREHRRLFSTCERMVVVMDADTGKVVATVPTGNGTDAAGFDPGAQLAFASAGEGLLTVIHEDSPDKFSLMDQVPTRYLARTLAVDLKTHTVYQVTVKRLPGGTSGGGGSVVPGSFVVIAVGK